MLVSPVLACPMPVYLTATRRRSLEDAIPSASLYFATVRLATWIPSCSSSSASLLSDSGSTGSSAATSLRILARIAVEDT
jgi:hypothetical protein